MELARRVLALTGLVAVTATRSLVDAQGSCSATPQQLTWSCGGLCDDYAPCLVFNASDAACDSTDCVTDDADTCAYYCFNTLYSDSKTAQFLIPFGSYESPEEAEERAADPNYDSKIAAFANSTGEYPWADNDELTSIGSVDLNPETNTLYVRCITAEATGMQLTGVG